ncbi:PHP domain-containing protein [Nonomuraea typhae]|uniref:Histidinol-phosphatase n=1 Tax=Nonomuraea typhae TaxID=2603600 RepID=A0ABW7YL54_9ACTN
MTLPADSHVHSEWSWDAPLGSMERTCEQALTLGLPVLAFTEHVDHTTWTVASPTLPRDTPAGPDTPRHGRPGSDVPRSDTPRHGRPGSDVPRSGGPGGSVFGTDGHDTDGPSRGDPGLAGLGLGDFDLGGLGLDDHLLSLTTPDGRLIPPPFDVTGYLEAIERCRDRFPSLRILSGMEIGEPHRHAAAVSKLLAAGGFDRVLGSLHCLPYGDGFAEPPGHYAYRDPADVVRDYLAEIARLVTQSDAFAVLAHIDYPLRYWPEKKAGPFDVLAFQEEFRHALRTTARSGRALEINTSIPLHPTLLRWWREEGGQAVTFGSDAHEPALLARRFREAADMATAHGFRPGRNLYDFWGRED